MELRVGDTVVASYVVDPELDVRVGPRPYLHPVRTLGGTVVTDALCYDHPWHLGASLAMQDVNGTNLWGGRTYVRDQGYTWLDDHGRIAHAAWLPTSGAADRPGGTDVVTADHPAGVNGFAEQLSWLDASDRPLLTERREVTAAAAPHGWRLSFAYSLTAPGDRDIALGSPATNGRPGGAGYGGFFWRAPPGAATAFTAGQDGEEKVNGSAEPWVAVTVEDSYTLVFEGLADDDRWFVRTGDYVGVCAALAFEHPLLIPAGATRSRRLAVLVADGTLTREEVQAALR